MKAGINAWSLPNHLSAEEMFKLTKEAGFDTIELNMAEDVAGDTIVSSLGLVNCQLLTTTTSIAALNDLKALSVKYDLPISSLSTDLHWKYVLSDACEDVREKGMTVARKMIDACHHLGGETVLIVPGVIRQSDDYETAYHHSQQAIKQLAEYAQLKDITIGIENVWNKFLLSPLEMKRYIDEIDHQHVKVYFDVGNVLAYGFPQQWIRTLGARIDKVHVKDFKNKVGNIEGFTQLLAGDVDWLAVTQALSDIGYDGPLTAELSPYKYHPEQLAKDTQKAIALIIKM